MFLADFLKAVKEKRESHPLWPQYANSKAIPFSVDLGFSTITMQSSVLGNIKDQVSNAEKVRGVLFGMKTENDIRINHCLPLKLNDDVNAIVNKSEKEFLGIYSTGTTPDEEDVGFLEKVFKNVRHSLFLLKSCKEEDEEPTMMYEVVYDRCINNLKERLLIEQLRNYPNGVIESNGGAGETSAKKFYFANVKPFHGGQTRFELDISDEKKQVPFAKFQEALQEVIREKEMTRGEEKSDNLRDNTEKMKEILMLANKKCGRPVQQEVKEDVRPTLSDYSVTIRNIRKDTEIDLFDIMEYQQTGEQRIDFVQLSEEICKEANLEIIHHFIININDSSDEDPILCYTQVLNESFNGLDRTVEGSKVKSAVSMLRRFLSL